MSPFRLKVVLMRGCAYIYVNSSPLSSFIFFPLSASPLSRCTVAMATIMIDLVPSNTKSFSEPKLKQSCRSSATDRGAEGMMGERGLLSLPAGVSALNSFQ